jgi:hypothetical protein
MLPSLTLDDLSEAVTEALKERRHGFLVLVFQVLRRPWFTLSRGLRGEVIYCGNKERGIPSVVYIRTAVAHDWLLKRTTVTCVECGYERIGFSPVVGARPRVQTCPNCGCARSLQ